MLFRSVEVCGAAVAATGECGHVAIAVGMDAEAGDVVAQAAGTVTASAVTAVRQKNLSKATTRL